MSDQNTNKCFQLGQILLCLYLWKIFGSAYNIVVEKAAGQQGWHIYEVAGPSAKYPASADGWVLKSSTGGNFVNFYM